MAGVPMATGNVRRCGRSLKHCFFLLKYLRAPCPLPAHIRANGNSERVTAPSLANHPKMLNSANPTMASSACFQARPALGSRVPLRGACRSLFGPIDHEELRGELKRQLKEIQARDCQRWNFDFQAGSPLGGTYRWEAQEGKDMPSFYRETPRQEKPECSKENGEARSPMTPAGLKGGCCPCGGDTPGAKKRDVKVAITDFFPKRKRSCSQKLPGESCAAHRPLLSMEQTPKKKIR